MHQNADVQIHIQILMRIWTGLNEPWYIYKNFQLHCVLISDLYCVEYTNEMINLFLIIEILVGFHAKKLKLWSQGSYGGYHPVRQWLSSIMKGTEVPLHRVHVHISHLLSFNNKIRGYNWIPAQSIPTTEMGATVLPLLLIIHFLIRNCQS